MRFYIWSTVATLVVSTFPNMAKSWGYDTLSFVETTVLGKLDIMNPVSVGPFVKAVAVDVSMSNRYSIKYSVKCENTYDYLFHEFLITKELTELRQNAIDASSANQDKPDEILDHSKGIVLDAIYQSRRVPIINWHDRRISLKNKLGPECSGSIRAVIFEPYTYTFKQYLAHFLDEPSYSSFMEVLSIAIIIIYKIRILHDMGFVHGSISEESIVVIKQQDQTDFVLTHFHNAVKTNDSSLKQLDIYNALEILSRKISDNSAGGYDMFAKCCWGIPFLSRVLDGKPAGAAIREKLEQAIVTLVSEENVAYVPIIGLLKSAQEIARRAEEAEVVDVTVSREDAKPVPSMRKNWFMKAINKVLMTGWTVSKVKHEDRSDHSEPSKTEIGIAWP